MEIKKILLPIDGSKRSYDAVKYGLKFASHFKDCSLTICHVINDEILGLLANYRQVNVDSLHEFYEEQADLYLKKAVEHAKNENFDEQFLHAITLRGDPSEEIITLSNSYDLIIMTMRSREHENIMGHVANRVIILSKIPVLLIR